MCTEILRKKITDITNAPNEDIAYLKMHLNEVLQEKLEEFKRMYERYLLGKLTSSEEIREFEEVIDECYMLYYFKYMRNLRNWKQMLDMYLREKEDERVLKILRRKREEHLKNYFITQAKKNGFTEKEIEQLLSIYKRNYDKILGEIVETNTISFSILLKYLRRKARKEITVLYVEGKEVKRRKEVIEEFIIAEREEEQYSDYVLSDYQEFEKGAF